MLKIIAGWGRFLSPYFGTQHDTTTSREGIKNSEQSKKRPLRASKLSCAEQRDPHAMLIAGRVGLRESCSTTELTNRIREENHPAKKLHV